MNQTYEIIWADVAENDLREIIEYMAIESPGNALKIIKKDQTKNIKSLHPS